MLKIILSILAIAFSAAACAETTKEPITFKGVALGKAGANGALLTLCMEKKSNYENNIFNSCDRKHFKKNHWSFHTNYGSLGDANVSFELDETEAIIEIQIRTLPKPSIPDLVAVMESKYGKPMVTAAAVENKFGMKFENTIYTWVDVEGNRITIDSIYDKVTNGRVLIESAARVKALQQLNDILKDAGKANL